MHPFTLELVLENQHNQEMAESFADKVAEYFNLTIDEVRRYGKFNGSYKINFSGTFIDGDFKKSARILANHISEEWQERKRKNKYLLEFYQNTTTKYTDSFYNVILYGMLKEQ